MYKRDYTFRMNVMEEIFEIRSCIEILANDIKVNTADEYMPKESSFSTPKVVWQSGRGSMHWGVKQGTGWRKL